MTSSPSPSSRPDLSTRRAPRGAARRAPAVTAAALALTLAATACGGGGGSDTDLGSVNLEIVGPWAGAEQEAFEQVLDLFESQTGATVTYSGVGDELSTVLQTRIQGGDVPDVALIPQPGLVHHFVSEGALVPLTDEVITDMDANMADAWREIGSVDGQAYGVYLKVTNKSLVWYNDDLFQETGAEVPETWDEFTELSRDLADVGVSPLSVAGADGWVLTDWFENAYLQIAGPEKYDALSAHEIPWTDPSVQETLETLAEVWGEPDLLAGGTGTLQTDFPTSVTNVFNDDPSAAMVVGADFIGGVVSSSTDAAVGEQALHYRFPYIAGDGEAVVVAGDAAVAMTDDEATMELLRFLSSPEAAGEWAAQGGFVSPNRHVTADTYADPLTGQVAEQIVTAGDNIRFDLSDLQPAAFGATVGDGMWQALQDFLGDPSDVEGTMERLEAEAAEAYGE
ncbi:ABC transporter substrate-binding protein [Nocardiopsis sp. N85]|uniref:ABC transporter substrate-binding protein n=1 Tax=Nocardiopsis sp. N85 TaxID=3029400 RepID=UPI00237F50B3|nr:ABC transporter substrate-binding protein [Nocardiopsis sp. N85]MDE3725333.1 ABC transporter substrate-binding protein [Nocardiopsis sp. N85]